MSRGARSAGACHVTDTQPSPGVATQDVGASLGIGADCLTSGASSLTSPIDCASFLS